MDASVSTNANALVDPVVIQSAVNVSALREGLELGVRRVSELLGIFWGHFKTSVSCKLTKHKILLAIMKYFDS